MSIVGGAGISITFSGGVESLVSVDVIEVGLPVNPSFVCAGFFVPALARGSEMASLVTKVVAYADLFLLCDGVSSGFGKGDAVMDLQELIYYGRRRYPQWGVILSSFISIYKSEIVPYVEKRLVMISREVTLLYPSSSSFSVPIYPLLTAETSCTFSTLSVSFQMQGKGYCSCERSISHRYLGNFRYRGRPALLWGWWVMYNSLRPVSLCGIRPLC